MSKNRFGSLLERVNGLLPRGQLAHRAAEALAALPPVEQPSLILYTPVVHNNPYQAMLYGDCPARGIAAIPVTFAEAVSERSTLPDGADVWVHVHWTNTVLARAKNETEALRLARRFGLGLDRLTQSGIRIIWTVHNVLPHEHLFTEAEVAVCEALAGRATIIHVLHERTPALVSGAYSLPPEKVRVVRHSSYLGVYPNDVSREEARQELGIPDESLVFASVGAIRPYKKLESLVDAFGILRSRDETIRLIIAGPPLDKQTARSLRARSSDTPGVLATLERVPDETLQVYMTAPDVLVLPYEDILNSGSLMLAFSFGKPVIASRRGLFTDLVTEDVGILFDPYQPQGLEEALARGRALTHPRFADAAMKRAESYRPEAMARDFADLIDSVR